jgi:hypothetical protein
MVLDPRRIVSLYDMWCGVYRWQASCCAHHTTLWKGRHKKEVTGRRGRRRNQLLDDFKERRGYCKLKEEALDRTLWITRFGRGYGPVVRQTTEWRAYGPVVRQTTEWRGYGPVVRQTAEWRAYGPVVRQTAEWRDYGPVVRQTAEWRDYGPVVRQTAEWRDYGPVVIQTAERRNDQITW